MSLFIPATKQIQEDLLAQFESYVGQDAPLAAKAFMRVLAVVIAGIQTLLYKFGVERAQQNLAITATGQDLIDIGENYGVTLKPAVAAVLAATLPGTDPTVIAALIEFVGDANGVRYQNDSAATTTGGIATLSLTAKETGAEGNLNPTDTLTISTQVAGAETVATVTALSTTGTDAENEEDYRTRILDQIQSQGGGGNAADYRNWAQETPGVQRAYPYAGRPVTDPTPSSPPERTVYIEATTEIDIDGLAPAGLLDDAREFITTDPETGNARQPLGLTDSTLFVVSISRTSFFVQINGLTVDIDIEVQVKADIETELTNYFLSLSPFVDGLDALTKRNDLITELTIGEVVQDVVGAAGGSAESVLFGLTISTFIPQYTLGAGEHGKLGTVTYV